MTLTEFEASVATGTPPVALPPVLLALWHDARGDWEAAHEVAQDVPDPDGAWVHAYLHRKEGDAGNAAYWYRRASKPVCRRVARRGVAGDRGGVSRAGALIESRAPHAFPRSFRCRIPQPDAGLSC